MLKYAMISLLALTTTAQAEMVCATRDSVVKQLAEKYGEAPRVRALTANGKMFEMFASKDGETWTAIVVDPDGKACVIGAGKVFEVLSWIDPKKGPEA